VTDTVVFEIFKEHIAALIESRHELLEIIARAVADRRLSNSEAIATANRASIPEQKRSLSAQLVGRMLSFLGLKPRLEKRIEEYEIAASGDELGGGASARSAPKQTSLPQPGPKTEKPSTSASKTVPQ
jgi:hypothetical protein